MPLAAFWHFFVPARNHGFPGARIPRNHGFHGVASPRRSRCARGCCICGSWSCWFLGRALRRGWGRGGCSNASLWQFGYNWLQKLLLERWLPCRSGAKCEVNVGYNDVRFDYRHGVLTHVALNMVASARRLLSRLLHQRPLSLATTGSRQPPFFGAAKTFQDCPDRYGTRFETPLAPSPVSARAVERSHNSEPHHNPHPHHDPHPFHRPHPYRPPHLYLHPQPHVGAAIESSLACASRS